MRTNQSVSPTYGVICAIISPLSSAIATVILYRANLQIGPLYVQSFASLLGSLLLLLSLRQQASWEWIPRIFNNRGTIVKLVFIRNIVGALLFNFGLYYTEAVKAVFFTKIEAYFVLAWSWLLFGERVNRSEFFLLLIHVAGAFLLSTSGNLEAFGKAQWGDLLIVAAMAVSAYSYFDSKKLSVEIGARAASLVTGGIGGLILLPLAIIFSTKDLSQVDNLAWGCLIADVLLFNVIAAPLWFTALHSVKSWVVSALRAVGPIAGVPAAYLFLGESLNRVQLIGGIIVMLTSAMIARLQFKAKGK